MDAYELRNALSQHNNGLNEVYIHSLVRSQHYSDGVRCFAQNAGNGAYWLLDILVTEPAIQKQAQEFALITLSVTGTSAVLTVTDGNDDSEPVYKREIEFTDCPEGEWKFYYENNLIILPSEY